jgi:uncharacterized protein YkwD
VNLLDMIRQLFGRLKPVPTPPAPIAPPLPTAVDAYDPASVAYVTGQAMTYTNTLRAGKGLGPFVVDLRLMRAAQAHAVRLAVGAERAHDHWQEEIAAAGFPASQRISQGLCYGVGMDWREGVNLLRDDPPHAEDLFDPSFTRIGAGWAVSADGVFTLVFNYG